MKRSVAVLVGFAVLPLAAQDFIYLLPSKEIAETGEDLFFKAYLMDRQTMAFSERSRTLYLEIRSGRDSLVWSEKYPLVGGRGDGHIYIGENWPQGIVELTLTDGEGRPVAERLVYVNAEQKLNVTATPDYRNLLQWRPAVLTDENGIAEIPFAASDVNTEFVGLVEAVDGTGLLGAQIYTFRVMK